MYITIEPGLHQTNIIMLSTLDQKKWKNHLRELVLWWNGLPKSLKSLRKSQFKSKIKQILLEIPQKTVSWLYWCSPNTKYDVRKQKWYNILYFSFISLSATNIIILTLSFRIISVTDYRSASVFLWWLIFSDF